MNPNKLLNELITSVYEIYIKRKRGILKCVTAQEFLFVL